MKKSEIIKMLQEDSSNIFVINTYGNERYNGEKGFSWKDFYTTYTNIDDGQYFTVNHFNHIPNAKWCCVCGIFINEDYMVGSKNIPYGSIGIGTDRCKCCGRVLPKDRDEIFIPYQNMISVDELIDIIKDYDCKNGLMEVEYRTITTVNVEEDI